MIDHHEARAWADHHEAYGHWVSDAARALGDTFRVLARIQYHRPWERGDDRREKGPAVIETAGPCPDRRGETVPRTCR